jgi:hypothetical protein
MKTKVIFRLHPDVDEPIAFLPDEKTANPSFISCYEHVGQHSDASLEYFTECRPATPDQYLPLKAEMENLFGYDFDVIDTL